MAPGGIISDLHSTRFSARQDASKWGSATQAAPVTIAKMVAISQQVMAAARAFGRPPVRSSGAPLMMLSQGRPRRSA